MKELIKIISWPTFWQAAARLITGLASVVLTLILTRNLGVENFGQFTAILTLATIFYMPADFGLNAIFVQLAQKFAIQKLFFNLFIIRLVWSVILIFVSFSIGTILYPGNTLAQILASATILTTTLTTTALALFQLKLKYFWQFLTSFAGSILTVFLILIKLENTLNIVLVFGAILAGQVLSACLNLGRVWSELQLFFGKIDLSLIKRYVLTSFPLALALIFNLIYFKVDIVLLSILKTSGSVGLYGAAVKIFEWAILPPVFLLNSTFPVLSKLFASDLAKFKNFTKITASILLISGVLIFLLLFSLSDFFVTLVGGEDFRKAGIALKILSTGIPVFYLTGLFMWLLVILGKRKELVWIYGGGLIFNLLANLILIPKFDFVAAAATTVLGESLILIVSLVLFLKSRI